MTTNRARHNRVLLSAAAIAAVLFLAGFGYGYQTQGFGKIRHAPDGGWLASLDCG